MKRIKTLEEFLGESNNPKIISEDLENYMFFGNLETIKRNAEMILSMDPIRIDEILKDGHDWASDHVSVANDNLDQVADFLANPQDVDEGSVYLSPQAEKEKRQREALDRLKIQIDKIKEKMKSDPENSGIHKMQLDITLMKIRILEMTKQYEEAKERMSRAKK